MCENKIFERLKARSKVKLEQQSLSCRAENLVILNKLKLSIRLDLRVALEKN